MYYNAKRHTPLSLSKVIYTYLYSLGKSILDVSLNVVSYLEINPLCSKTKSEMLLQ